MSRLQELQNRLAFYAIKDVWGMYIFVPWYAHLGNGIAPPDHWNKGVYERASWMRRRYG